MNQKTKLITGGCGFLRRLARRFGRGLCACASFAVGRAAASQRSYSPSLLESLLAFAKDKAGKGDQSDQVAKELLESKELDSKRRSSGAGFRLSPGCTSCCRQRCGGGRAA
eukprot:3428208-Amphidinium_carterae.1